MGDGRPRACNHAPDALETHCGMCCSNSRIVRDALARQLDDAHAAIEAHKQDRAHDREELRKALLQNRELRSAVLKYGSHLDGCKLPCDCGLEEVTRQEKRNDVTPIQGPRGLRLE